MNRRLKSFILTLAAISTLSTPIIANAEWKQNTNGWYFLQEDDTYAKGWKLIDKQWYYFNENEYMQTGWVYDHNSWWYLDPLNGNLIKDTVVDGIEIDKNGRAKVEVAKEAVVVTKEDVSTNGDAMCISANIMNNMDNDIFISPNFELYRYDTSTGNYSTVNPYKKKSEQLDRIVQAGTNLNISFDLSKYNLVAGNYCLVFDDSTRELQFTVD